MDIKSSMVKKDGLYPSGLRGIVFSDLDGTILDNSISMIHESTMKAIELAKANHYLFVLTTGRDMDTHYSRMHKEKIKPDAIIHSNGARITIGDTELFRHYIDRDVVRRAYEYCREGGYCIGSSIGDEDFFVNAEKKYRAESMYKKIVKRNFVPFEQIFERNMDVVMMSYVGDLSVEKPLFEAAFPELEMFPFTMNTSADVVARGYTKAAGYRRICEYFGIAREDTYAIGDSKNDIPLLEAAGTSIAMGEADEAAKRSADYVTDDIAKDGFYKAMLHFGIIRE